MSKVNVAAERPLTKSPHSSQNGASTSAHAEAHVAGKPVEQSSSPRLSQHTAVMPCTSARREKPHAHAPPQGEYYDPYYGYDAAPPPIHDYPGYPGRHPRHRPLPGSKPPGAPPFPGGFRRPPPPRGYGGPPGPRGPHDTRDPHHSHHYGGRAGPPPPPPLGGDVGRRARAAASSALDAGAAGDYAGAHPDADVDELANLLMAWYYAGYYTGQYSKRGGGEDAGAAEEGTY